MIKRSIYLRVGVFTFQLLVGHVVYLPEPEETLLRRRGQELEALDLLGEVAGAGFAGEEVMDVEHHGLGHGAPA